MKHDKHDKSFTVLEVLSQIESLVIPRALQRYQDSLVLVLIIEVVHRSRVKKAVVLETLYRLPSPNPV
jgi:hypothetical protein